jgi:hypothetical protein
MKKTKTLVHNFCLTFPLSLYQYLCELPLLVQFAELIIQLDKLDNLIGQPIRQLEFTLQYYLVVTVC